MSWSKRVLIFDETLRDLPSYLLAFGYNCSVKNINELENEIKSFRYDFILLNQSQWNQEKINYIRKSVPSLGIVCIGQKKNSQDPLIKHVKGEFLEEVKIALDAININRLHVLELISEAWNLERKLEEENREIDIEHLLQVMGPKLKVETGSDTISWIDGEELTKFLKVVKSEGDRFKEQVSLRFIGLDLDSKSHKKLKKSVFGWDLSLFNETNEWIQIDGNILLQPVYLISKLVGCVCYENMSFDKIKYLDNSPFFYLFKSKLKHFAVISEYKNKTNIDYLTDLYNQKYLTEVLEKNVKIYQRDKIPFSVLFIDVDHFKKVNDSNGHLVGSNTLRLISNVLKNAVRVYDYVFRYGGDEFIVVLSNADTKVSHMVAERLRSAIEKANFKSGEVDLSITVSIGVAVFPQHASTASELIKLADKAMYDAKSRSRNIVYIAS